MFFCPCSTYMINTWGLNDHYVFLVPDLTLVFEMMVLALGLSMRSSTSPSPVAHKASPRPAMVVSHVVVVAVIGLLAARTDIGLASILDWPRTGGNVEPGDMSPPAKGMVDDLVDPLEDK